VSCFQSSLLQLDGADSINDKFQGFFWPGLDSELIEISLGAFKAKLFQEQHFSSYQRHVYLPTVNIDKALLALKQASSIS
jgi:hypothetical protein